MILLEALVEVPLLKTKEKRVAGTPMSRERGKGRRKSAKIEEKRVDARQAGKGAGWRGGGGGWGRVQRTGGRS